MTVAVWIALLNAAPFWLSRYRFGPLATFAPADAFRLADRGRIAPGLRADLLLVEGDPTLDILATRNIVAIWKRGEPVARQRYD